MAEHFNAVEDLTIRDCPVDMILAPSADSVAPLNETASGDGDDDSPDTFPALKHLCIKQPRPGSAVQLARFLMGRVMAGNPIQTLHIRDPFQSHFPSEAEIRLLRCLVAEFQAIDDE
ncbi:hypothetical protein HGRIS_012219 [Hohenbuehelia grisea]|uniref:Uncharacterized protein n=1 Tax=Hohenbuehelia grisea TaxID=104357 RepID=A0ABR3IRL4_9AGAR